MFTGIVADLGRVIAVEPHRLVVRAALLTDTALGDSVAINGVCLTVTTREDDTATFDVMAETWQRTALGDATAGDDVNLELAVTPTTRLGGHIVQGHVDGVATITRREPGEAWDVVTLAVPSSLSRYVVEKGSVCLDGVSLTVVAVDHEYVTVSLIPETLRRTTWGNAAIGRKVNVEVDVVAKYVERLLGVGGERVS